MTLVTHIKESRLLIYDSLIWYMTLWYVSGLSPGVMFIFSLRRDFRDKASWLLIYDSVICVTRVTSDVWQESCLSPGVMSISSLRYDFRDKESWCMTLWCVTKIMLVRDKSRVYLRESCLSLHCDVTLETKSLDSWYMTLWYVWQKSGLMCDKSHVS